MPIEKKIIYQKKWDSLIRSVSESAYDEAQKLLTKENANAVDKNGDCLLIIAARNDDYRMINYIMLKDADINARANDGRTALMVSSLMGHANAIATILKYEPELDLQDNHGDTAVNLAASKAEFGAFTWLMRAGANYVYCNKDGDNVIGHSIASKSPQMLEMLKAYEIVPHHYIPGANIKSKTTTKIDLEAIRRLKTTKTNDMDLEVDDKDDEIDMNIHTFKYIHLFFTAIIITSIYHWEVVGPFLHKYVITIGLTKAWEWTGIIFNEFLKIFF